MNLNVLAEADLATTLEDSVNGFGRAITITDLEDPANEYAVVGQYNRVGVDIDPESGLLVAGNKSSITVRLSSLGEGIYPENDWIVETTDITGATVKSKVAHVFLDRSLGVATMLLKK